MNSLHAATPDCIALIVSAGRGQRFGGEIPKQYIEIAGESLLARAAGALLSHPRIAAVRAVIHSDDEDLNIAIQCSYQLLKFGCESEEQRSI